MLEVEKPAEVFLEFLAEAKKRNSSTAGS